MSHAAETPGSRTRAVAGRPLVSRSRTVTAAPAGATSASAFVRPEASGFPRGFTALTVTLSGSTDSPPATAASGPAPAAPVPGPAPVTAIRSWL